MKPLVFLLVVANLLLYALGAGLFGKPENPDAVRVAQQIQPEAMRLVAQGEAAPAATAAVPAFTQGPAAEASPVVTANETPAQVAMAADEPKAAAPAPALAAADTLPLCLRWEGLTVQEVDRVAAMLANRFRELRVSRRKVPAEVSSWWVFVPPQADRAAADKRAEELRQAGIGDFFVVLEGNNRLAISLGIFASEKGAQERLAEMKAQGVRGVRLAPRQVKEPTFNLRASGPGGQRIALEAAMARVLPNGVAKACP